MVKHKVAEPVEREKRGQFVYVRLVPDRLANTVFAWAAEVETRLPVMRPDALTTSLVAETTVVPLSVLLPEPLPMEPPRFRMLVAAITVCVPPLITPELVALPVA